MKKLCAMIAVLCVLAGCGPAPAASDEPKEKQPGIGIHHAEIVVKDYGTITLELDGDEAPVTVQNFMDLASEGFYDGTTFHRLMEGFMIQGGDPTGSGTGGSGEHIIGEFAENGIENNISHVEGVISMARTAVDYDSASSQFFITVADATSLDGSYAAFGHVTSGLEVAKKLAADAEPYNNNGMVYPEDQPIIERITILD